MRIETLMVVRVISIDEASEPIAKKGGIYVSF